MKEHYQDNACTKVNCRVLKRPLQSLRRRILDRLVLRPSRGPIDPGPQQRIMLRRESGGEQLEEVPHLVVHAKWVRQDKIINVRILA